MQSKKTPSTITGNGDFYEFAQKFIAESEQSKAEGTIRSYRQTLSLIQEFRPKFRFKDFDAKLYDAFLSFMAQRGISDTTAGKHIKIIKTILNEATDRGLNSNLEFRAPNFKVFRKRADNVYLTPKEIAQLTGFRHKLSEPKRKVLDLFLIGCHTGLAFLDISSLTAYLVRQEGTRQYVLKGRVNSKDNTVVEVNEEVAAILDEYDGVLPRAISEQKTNKALKEICRKAGLEQRIHVKTTMGTEAASRAVCKYELVSIHTARLSFATNAYLSGVPVSAIMKITGHNLEKSFMQYINASKLENRAPLY